MQKIDYEGTRSAWLKNAGAEGEAWLQHITKRADEITELQQKRYGSIFQEAELLFNVSSFLNWLAHIDLRKAHRVEEKDIIPWLTKTTKWPKEICEAFWFCLRNPVMHTGRSFIFSDYERVLANGQKLRVGFHPNMNFDPKEFQPIEFKPTEVQDGYYAFDNPISDRYFDVEFYFAGVYRKLELALQVVMQGIEAADKNSLASLNKVNRKLLAFRIVG